MKPLILGLAAVLALSACQVRKAPDLDYTSFKESKPASILVVTPLNESPDVNGTWGMLASTAAPISEAGLLRLPRRSRGGNLQRKRLDQCRRYSRRPVGKTASNFRQ